MAGSPAVVAGWAPLLPPVSALRWQLGWPDELQRRAYAALRVRLQQTVCFRHSLLQRRDLLVS